MKIEGIQALSVLDVQNPHPPPLKLAWHEKTPVQLGLIFYSVWENHPTEFHPWFW